MKKTLLICAILTTALSSFAAGGKASSSGKTRLILFGNEQAREQFLPEEALSLFAKSTQKNKPILIIGWVQHKFANDSTRRAWSGIASHTQQEFKHLPNSPTTPAEVAEVVRLIGEAGGILIAGEYPEYLMEGLKDPSIKEAIKTAYGKGTVIGGMGAGAQVMGTTVIKEQTVDDVRTKKVNTMEGLGLLDIAGKNTIIEDNFNTRREKAISKRFTPVEWGYSVPRLLLGMKATDAVGLAIDSGTALIVDNGTDFKVLTDRHIPRVVRIYSTTEKSQLNLVQKGDAVFGNSKLEIGDNEALKVTENILNVNASLCSKVFN